MTQYESNLQFLDACVRRNLADVRYALTSPEISIHAQINCNQDEGLITAC